MFVPKMGKEAEFRMDAAHDQSVAAVSTEVGTSAAGKRRQMVRAALLGQHTHESLTGVRVHIFRRDGQYLARARYQKAFFGETLGGDVRQASARLRHLLTELDNGSFLRPSVARRRVLKSKAVPKLDLHELCDAFLTEKRKLRGKRTAATYLSRLAPVLEFADRPTSRQRWPLAQDLDRDFAVELRTFLMAYQVTRNGRPGATAKTMSTRQVHNVLTCLQGVLAWARQPGVRKLSSDFANPLTPEIVGRRPDKDPLRPVKLSLERRLGQYCSAQRLLSGFANSLRSRSGSLSVVFAGLARKQLLVYLGCKSCHFGSPTLGKAPWRSSGERC